MLRKLVPPAHAGISRPTPTNCCACCAVPPAHAGISRATRRPWPVPPRSPRPRGDQSSGSSGSTTVTVVPPAHAGISRSPGSTTTAPNGFPPPTRGSVARTGAAGTFSMVPPAHAGISRSTAVTDGSSPGSPRPRGDQSLPKRFGRRAGSFPPPTRGSVVPALLDDGGVLVPPAHAGISRIGCSPPYHAERSPRPRGDQSFQSPALVTT